MLEPFLPPPSPVARPRKWPLRRIVEAILYLLRGGLPWRMHQSYVTRSTLPGKAAPPEGYVAPAIDMAPLSRAEGATGWRGHKP